MNRLQQLLRGRPEHDAWLEWNERETNGRELCDGSGSGESASLGAMHASELEIPHRLFVPEHFEPRYDYPLVVWLHSEDSSEWELDSVMEAISLRNYLAIAPRGNRTSARSSRRFRWGTELADLAIAESLVFECIDALIESLPIHSDRIFLAGVGGGGTVAQWIGLKHPSRFAGVISMQGAFPQHRHALSSWKEARRLPVLLMQGEPTPDCGDEAMIQAMQLAHAAGLGYRFVRFRDSRGRSIANDPAEGSGSLDSEMFATANRFLMGIVTQTQISLEPEMPANTFSGADPLPVSFGCN